MKNIFILITLIFLSQSIYGQYLKTVKDFGYTHIALSFKNDKVDILVKSKKGEENIQKPLLFFCQGSLPIPLIKYKGSEVYGVFPFNPDSILKKYHIVIVSKPYIPLIADIKILSPSFNYIDSTEKFPKEYSDRNLLNYYVKRNIKVIKYLQKQNWVSKTELVVAGHSEGSTVATKMSVESDRITHLIYASGNPMGRIMSMIGQGRVHETYTDSVNLGEEEIKYWEEVVKNKNNLDDSHGDTHKATFEFSDPPIKQLEKLKIPVLVSYGTKDESAPFNDFMRIDFIRKEKKNFTFNSYVGTEHNFFPLTANNKPNYDVFNWDKVANDWLRWLNQY